MSTTTLIAFLAFFTLVCALAFAIYNRKRTDDRRQDPAAPKSSLAPDSPGPGAREALDRENRP